MTGYRTEALVREFSHREETAAQVPVSGSIVAELVREQLSVFYRQVNRSESAVA